MHFGLFYLFSDFGNIPQDQVFNEVLDEIEYAEELGFDSIWLPEHHFAVYGMLGNPLTLAAAIAQRTTKMKIGTAVMILPFQHPLRVAEDAALVDALSGGRLLLGLGRGYQPPEFHGFGVPQSDSSAMFNESFEIIRRALSGEKFTFGGRFWNIEEPTEIFPKPIQKPHPPFYLASVTPRSLDIAARNGMSLLRAPQFSTLDTVAEAYTTYRSMMREHGHDPDSLDQPLSVRTYVAPTMEDARAEAEHVVWFYKLMATLLPGAPGRPAPPSGYENYPQDPSALSAITVDDVLERGTAFGTPDRVIETMKTYMHRLGATSFMTQMRIGGLKHSKVRKSMELFAKEVMPALREEEAKMEAATADD
ncbi:MAG: LLM class flavin-dependent oxidoreductase [SAR202 cluster bacterium]|jgi:alkanesulfonate monooxygenase SsuD/methylene tetrahydromethanopterin reductase-like flavin-dependent oxidoreductase (luciferase family)|nr:LLM class flavin-dependent oxidoreductase [SAR202 cluster bacterium]MDP6302182.1 LLM class flavin-dependent oxidoreductase [SAR202 cluster bacterium]MDP7104186.1 LLM class flavin-dependent oxidoreductase [SAR202 cluster bacterium]MDP7225819.1 LLM class flavin-dependent oxidoreductase [SAR202 cluster bacterium]MDP7413676.1 LLM class flavin-dependent oxidoreductase [SAR202 cluster bacterium]|tara:strand:+ start:4392 stop:5480 length:1089 start_codon:yes stop_codon:yes gene_type:complete